jgi:hypothetical protein
MTLGDSSKALLIVICDEHVDLRFAVDLGDSLDPRVAHWQYGDLGLLKMSWAGSTVCFARGTSLVYLAVYLASETAASASSPG